MGSAISSRAIKLTTATAHRARCHLSCSLTWSIDIMWSTASLQMNRDDEIDFQQPRHAAQTPHVTSARQTADCRQAFLLSL